ncbi:hypothetical protein CLF_100714 [Clonorchis sinensis]|uniref:Uncharacterized protein n=1 Tax=Clonorchis sinensis TaxID=79923 RepID=G7Y429_CLOSI|nr:hypothetical protein CLF_100714 [Clonorchis sinensis]
MVYNKNREQMQVRYVNLSDITINALPWVFVFFTLFLVNFLKYGSSSLSINPVMLPSLLGLRYFAGLDAGKQPSLRFLAQLRPKQIDPKNGVCLSCQYISRQTTVMNLGKMGFIDVCQKCFDQQYDRILSSRKAIPATSDYDGSWGSSKCRSMKSLMDNAVNSAGLTTAASVDGDPVIIVVIDSITSVFSTDASLSHNYDLFESLIVKKRVLRQLWATDEWQLVGTTTVVRSIRVIGGRGTPSKATWPIAPRDGRCGMSSFVCVQFMVVRGLGYCQGTYI